MFLAVKLARHKLSKYYAEVNQSTCILLISAHICKSFWKLRLVRTLDTGMDIDPEDETSYPTQYQEAFLKYVENKYCPNH